MIKKENIKSGYKKTPVGIIPDDWDVKKFGQFLEFKNGVNASKDDYGKGIKFINVLEVITNSSLRNEEVPGEVQITEKEFKRYKVERGDILFNRTSETQEEIALSSVYLDDYPTVFGGFVIRGRFVKNIYIDDFKKYVFRNFYVRKQIISKGQGAVRVNIGQSDLEKVFIPIPPLPEQKAIADCLSTWDRAIKKQTQLIHAKKEFKKGLMQGFFNGKLSIINDQLVKAEEGQDFTENWEEVKFKNIFLPKKVIAGENCEEYEVLSVTKNGIVSQKEYFNKSVASSNKTNYLVIKKGDFVLSGLNFWMGSYDVLTEYSEGVISPAYKVFSITPRKDKAFIYSLIKTDKFLRSMVGSSVQGASIVRRNLDKDMMMNWKFKMPILELQMKIGQVLQSADKEIELLEKKLTQLQLQKKGLMQVLLTGEKRLV